MLSLCSTSSPPSCSCSPSSLLPNLAEHNPLGHAYPHHAPPNTGELACPTTQRANHSEPSQRLDEHHIENTPTRPQAIPQAKRPPNPRKVDAGNRTRSFSPPWRFLKVPSTGLEPTSKWRFLKAPSSGFEPTSKMAISQNAAARTRTDVLFRNPTRTRTRPHNMYDPAHQTRGRPTDRRRKKIFKHTPRTTFPWNIRYFRRCSNIEQT